MAKLQGHFMKYSKNPQECLDKVDEILKDSNTINEMTIVEWLNRLNLKKRTH